MHVWRPGANGIKAHNDVSFSLDGGWHLAPYPVHEFQYWLKIANFSPPLFIQHPCSGWPLSNLWKSSTDPETRVFQAADGEDLVIIACTVFDWSTRVKNGRTDRIAMTKTRYSSIAAVARKNWSKTYNKQSIVMHVFYRRSFARWPTAC